MKEWNKIITRGYTQNGLEGSLLFLVVDNLLKACIESRVRK